jgi:hypothetical protein
MIRSGVGSILMAFHLRVLVASTGSGMWMVPRRKLGLAENHLVMATQVGDVLLLEGITMRAILSCLLDHVSPS